MITDPREEANQFFIRSGVWQESTEAENLFKESLQKYQSEEGNVSYYDCPLLTIFSIEFMKALNLTVTQAAPSSEVDRELYNKVRKPLLDVLQNARPCVPNSVNSTLFPSHRFVIAALLKLINLNDLTSRLDQLLGRIDAAERPGRIPLIEGTQFTRRSFVPPQRDPLLILYERLHITRF
jgi:hypothetical protein